LGGIMRVSNGCCNSAAVLHPARQTKNSASAVALKRKLIALEGQGDAMNVLGFMLVA
jgi:hypothetical protein